ncbi:hypothetical protein MCU_01580 [Bartonella elizabethae Re6043vi]|uniref:Uncharacterized protein n=2 Tax=Bartonella elizabethae TaxID=807 RepID=J0RAP7_BAREL|nr:hypothetical protein [Bartonella elizabethae]EJF82260.1 hypothetical protein MCU_01580 [Bartonella elizabethae Re6043vi]EJF92844.1 hypothetical protein MEE_01569 [Bartonella elizabethae F9251 = ATCC 49927]VEJ41717.1 Uncharacterised protein [Bartonella elizabethae]
MFKVFKNNFYCYIFIAFILFFAQGAESHIDIAKEFFQRELFFTHQEKNRVNQNIDRAVIYLIEEKNQLTFMKVRQESCFSAFWGIISFFMTILVFGFR